MPSAFSSISSFAYTLFLFTKSDIKTTVMPITVLATAAALHDIRKLPHVIFWIWMHILQFDLGNQIINPEEDKLNKKDRPLASDRITLRNAQILRWVSIPACLLLSACYSAETVYASIAIAVLSLMYNELGGHLNWMSRSTLLPVDYAFFEIGACLVASQDPHKLGDIAMLSVLMSAGAYGTTNQATDFKDIEGDRLLGRKTIPIAAPTLSRPTLLLLMFAWSIALTRVWELDILATVAFSALGFAVGARFMLFQSVVADKKSCLLYNIWLSTIHILPAYWRFVVSTSAQI